MSTEAPVQDRQPGQREKILSRLDVLRIPYELTEHPAVYTMEEIDELGIDPQGDICKNLFLRDAKGRRHFLVVLRKDKRADLESIQKQLGCSRLSFASPDRLMRILGLSQGEVTPFGILNDSGLLAEVALDRDLADKPRLGVHPNENTATLWLSYGDLLRVVEACGNTIHLLEI